MYLQTESWQEFEVVGSWLRPGAEEATRMQKGTSVVANDKSVEYGKKRRY